MQVRRFLIPSEMCGCLKHKLVGMKVVQVVKLGKNKGNRLWTEEIKKMVKKK